MSKSTKQKVLIHLDGRDDPIEVNIDQRDFSAIERARGKPFSELPPIEGMRWVAWHAAKRSLLLAMSWDEFEAACGEVGADTEAEEILPTQPGPEGG